MHNTWVTFIDGKYERGYKCRTGVQISVSDVKNERVGGGRKVFLSFYNKFPLSKGNWEDFL